MIYLTLNFRDQCGRTFNQEAVEPPYVSKETALAHFQGRDLSKDLQKAQEHSKNVVSVRAFLRNGTVSLSELS